MFVWIFGGATLGDAKGLLLYLHSERIPGGACGAIWMLMMKQRLVTCKASALSAELFALAPGVQSLIVKQVRVSRMS